MSDEEYVERRRALEQPVKVVFGQYAMTIATGVFCLFIILGVMAYGIIVTNKRAQEVQDQQVKVAACILEQLAEHRIASQNHHEDSAAIAGKPYTPPPGVKPPPFRPDDSICAQYFPNPGGMVEVD